MIAKAKGLASKFMGEKEYAEIEKIDPEQIMSLMAQAQEFMTAEDGNEVKA